VSPAPDVRDGQGLRRTGHVHDTCVGQTLQKPIVARSAASSANPQPGSIQHGTESYARLSPNVVRRTSRGGNAEPRTEKKADGASSPSSTIMSRCACRWCATILYLYPSPTAPLSKRAYWLTSRLAMLRHVCRSSLRDRWGAMRGARRTFAGSCAHARLTRGSRRKGDEGRVRAGEHSQVRVQRGSMRKQHGHHNQRSRERRLGR
jgi:hypothetical protein